MAKTVEVDKLLEGLTLTDEEKKVALSIFGKQENHETLSRRFLRREEGSRIADEAAKAKTEAERIRADAEKKDKDADAYARTLQEWETGKKKDLAYVEYLKSIGVAPTNPTDIPDPKKPDVDTPTKPSFDEAALNKSYLRRDEAAAAVRMTVDLPVEIAILNEEHKRLYDGKPVPADELRKLKDAYIKTGTPFSELGREALHFADREKELQEKDVEARVETLVKERMEKFASERGIQNIGGNSVEDPTDKIIYGEKFSENVTRPDVTSTNANTYERFNQVAAELAQTGVNMTQ